MTESPHPDEPTTVSQAAERMAALFPMPPSVGPEAESSAADEPAAEPDAEMTAGEVAADPRPGAVQAAPLESWTPSHVPQATMPPEAGAGSVGAAAPSAPLRALPLPAAPVGDGGHARLVSAPETTTAAAAPAGTPTATGIPVERRHESEPAARADTQQLPPVPVADATPSVTLDALFPPRHTIDLTDEALDGPREGLLGMEARSVSAWFGDHKVLEGVSLTIAPGEVTALIGPSGCGKSTFLRILNRMHEMIKGASLAGEVLLDDADIYQAGRRPAEVRRRIGMVFQRPNPFPAMSIYDNVVSGLKLAGIHCDDKDSLVEQSLSRAGLWTEVRSRLQSPGGALSGGQQQRLCIARSLAVSPDVLLMDEPCSALDPTSTRRIEDTIAELRGQVTIAIVTHNMQQAARVSQACAFFLATHDTPGHIVESGPTADLFSSPRDSRTADYVNGRFG